MLSIKGFIRSYGTLIALGAIIAVFSVIDPRAFLSAANLWNITRQMAILCIISLGTTLIMTVGEFDLSVGNIASLGGVIAALLSVIGVPVPIAFLLSMIAGGAVGFANGFIVTRFSVMSFIITLAMGRAVYGITYALSDGAIIFNSIPDSFRIIGTGRIGGIPYLTFVMVLFLILFQFFMRRSASGRRFYAIGGNERASVVAGISVRKYKTIAFTVSGAMAGLAGVLLASRIGSASPTGGDAYCLNSYATVFIGKTLFRNGVPDMLGTFVGTALFAVIANGLTITQVPTFIQNIITGAVIVLAVVFQKLGSGRV